MDAFDLDVAACDEARCAPEYFSIQRSGLIAVWSGRVWCNPPFSDCGAWVLKAWEEWERYERKVSNISMLLPATRTEQHWWQSLVERFRDGKGPLRTHFLPGRTSFGMPGNPTGIGVGSPPFTCVLLVWR